MTARCIVTVYFGEALELGGDGGVEELVAVSWS